MKEIVKAVKERWKGQKYSTSLFFKKGLISFFEDKGLERALEVTGGQGSTTHVLSHLFKEVTYVDLPFFWRDVAAIAIENNKDRDNITFKKLHPYRDEWDFPPQDCIMIDCNHRYDFVVKDIKNSLRFLKPNGYLVFHDYSLNVNGDKPELPAKFDVKQAVHAFVNDGELVIVHCLGPDLENPEGVICMRGNQCHQLRS